eukprot:gene3822-13894_t
MRQIRLGSDSGAELPQRSSGRRAQVQVTILDSKNQQAPVGTVGEVSIRGPNVMGGYLNNPKANVEAFAGGWFHTGDQGWIDADGYLTLTGRIKELINRAVAEAVCFGAPDEKYGEVVAAAVVLKPDAAASVKAGGADAEKALAEEIRKQCAVKLSAFKIPAQIFFTAALPKGPTGKIQRKNMASAFIKPGGPASSGPAPSAPSKAPGHVAGMADGYALATRTMKALGINYMFGVVGIPVTPLASAAQAAGIRFIGFRNEQAAGYAAAAAGYLSGTPAVLLTVSGPGAINGLAGLSNASINCWPMIQISGSCEQSEVGKGAFQECDQVSALGKFCKYAGQAHSVKDIPSILSAAFHSAASGRPGASYVDIPSNILMEPCDEVALSRSVGPSSAPKPSPPASDISAAAALLRSASRPLLVVGKGAAMARAEGGVQQLCNKFGISVLGTAMGRGCIPDSHHLCVNAARSQALAQSDVVATALWQLHFGEPPKWSPSVKFILVDIEPSPRDSSVAALTLVGDAAAALDLLVKEMSAAPAALTLVGDAADALDLLAKEMSAAPGVGAHTEGVFGPSPRDSSVAAPTLVGDAAAALDLLAKGMSAAPGVGTQRRVPCSPLHACVSVGVCGGVFGPSPRNTYIAALTLVKDAGAALDLLVQSSVASLSKKLAAPPKDPLDYYTALGVLRSALEAEAAAGPAPVVVSEGANTMDMARLLLPVHSPRTRLDAGTWGTMGVGLGYAIASAVVDPTRLTVAVEGDSAFGFSGMEIETMVRYKLPIVVIVMNNGGIYGGDRREKDLAAAAATGAQSAGFSSDPTPTEFADGSRYDMMMAAFGGAAYHVTTAAELQQVLARAFAARQPALVDIALDPMAGVESGNVHAFNAPTPSKL